jgi:hypothetical protein
MRIWKKYGIKDDICMINAKVHVISCMMNVKLQVACNVYKKHEGMYQNL